MSINKRSGCSVLRDKKMSNRPYFWFPSPRITQLEWITFLKFMVWHIIWAITASLDCLTKIVQVGLKCTEAEVRQECSPHKRRWWHCSQNEAAKTSSANTGTCHHPNKGTCLTHTGGGFLPASVLGGFVNLQEKAGGWSWLAPNCTKTSQRGPEKKQEETV